MFKRLWHRMPRSLGPLLLALAVALTAFMVMPHTALAADPTGAETLEADPGAPIDYIWILVSAFLVFFMQGGFAMLEAGFCRAKNVVNLMMKNLMDFVIGSLAYFILGFALMFGTSQAGLFGTSGFFLAGANYDVGTYLLFMFEVVFAATAATIVSGAVAERIKVKAYFIYSEIGRAHV